MYKVLCYLDQRISEWICDDGWILKKPKVVSELSNHFAKKSIVVIYSAILSLHWLLLLSYSPSGQAEQPSEYRLKVAFLYNFAAYTEWPHAHNSVLNLCIHGEDPFGENLRHIRQKKVNEQELLIRHTKKIEDLPDCQIVFITRSVVDSLDSIINLLDGKPILTVADTPGVGQQGVALNMAIKEGKVIFEANLTVARKNGLRLSAQLLRFATKVYQE
ncbi:YfiR family protein [Nitrosomonas sp. Nm84]|uniref:YfiR family protein n=1 Tax=Nitrosomonas sp. Nm84 TaxID=200124 RepID=UPI0021AD2D26|nr:YfiR family protein [Nitrosomonas sp. Nm84]